MFHRIMGMFIGLLDGEDKGSILLQNAGNYDQTQCHNLQDLNLQQHECENLRFCKLRVHYEFSDSAG